jgi:hypothetical protein
MKPKVLHQQAMDYSFQAKQAMSENNYSYAYTLYKNAADLESQVAEFYFDKPELEPTRGIVIRSAAFLNLKAGQIENAQKFIFFGLLNIKDELIINQLNNALELSVSLKNSSPEAISGELSYLNLLRQRSIHYILEPSSLEFGRSVSLEMVKDFSEGYLKSLKAFGKSTFKKMQQTLDEFGDTVANEFEKMINPLITNNTYGSFKFSIANDIYHRHGESKEFSELKSNIISKYHNEIFINPLTDEEITKIKTNYTEEEINEIFRPLVKIKSNNSLYKIGYYDSETLNKTFVDRIINIQRKKLLPITPLSKEDIGELESSIIHKKSSLDGKVTKKTIFKEQLKAYEFDTKINQIDAKNYDTLILNEEILVNINFNSELGFRFSFDDFNIDYLDIEYERGLKEFLNSMYNKIVLLSNSKDKSEQELRDWDVIRRLIGNPEALKKT